MTRLLLALVIAAALAAAGCSKGEAGNPAPAPATPEKAAPAQPAKAPAEKATAPVVTPPQASASAAVSPPTAADVARIAALAANITAEGTPPPPPKTKAVDNSRCFVCHLNFSDDVMAISHAKVGIGCEKCHGSSDDHASDEGNVTPPQIMYPHEKIDASCKVCHPDPMERIVAGAKYCLHVLLTEEEKKKVCTDCHGTHKMAQRQVRWDKTTGKILPAPPAAPKAAVKS
ncbi:MAG: hypothetical protein NT049_17680 [Planctomycetota bacterium]|nr:hypothetical protein [Planctomycetota bacterium]